MSLQVNKLTTCQRITWFVSCLLLLVSNCRLKKFYFRFKMLKLERRSSIEEEYMEIDNFFKLLPKPDNLEQIHDQVVRFCEKHQNNKIVLVTVSF